MPKDSIRQDDLNREIAFYNIKDVHRQIIKWLRNLAYLNHRNQFSASIEVIRSFSLLIDSLFSFLKEKKLDDAYFSNVKTLYPKEFELLLNLWGSYLHEFDNNIVRQF